MKSSKMNQLVGAADEKQRKKSGEHELAEEALESIQGGELSPQQLQEAEQLVHKVAEHHGVSVSATTSNYIGAALITTGAYAGGQALFKRKKSQQ